MKIYLTTSSKLFWNTFITFIIFFSTVHSITWLGLSRYYRSDEHELIPFSAQECAIVSRNYGLKKRQANFCFSDKHSYAMHGIINAAKAAVYYCMKTFADRRWNCSSARELPKLKRDLQIGTQEQAVVHAFSTVALMYEVARRCSTQKIKHCSCGYPKEFPSYSYQESEPSTQNTIMTHRGCPDNVDIGQNYVKRFTGFHRMGRPKKRRKNIDARLKKRRKKRLPYFLRQKRLMEKIRKRRIKRINGHNYKAGVSLLLDNMRKHCKCHGVSGSCSQKVCFRQLRRLDDDHLSKTLRSKYLHARYVKVDNDGTIRPVHPYLLRSLSTVSMSRQFISNNIILSNQQHKVKKRSLIRAPPITATDLVFTAHSPDYCEPDENVGSLGTRNRSCFLNVPESATNHCSYMCCGRGYRSEMVKEKRTCGCRIDAKFQIICNYCYHNIKKFYCL